MNRQSCEELKGLLMDVLYDEASLDGDPRLQDHLAGCDECRQELGELRRVRARLAAAAPVVETAPATVVVLEAPRSARWTRWAGLAAAAALAGLGILAVLQAEVGVGTDGVSISFAGRTTLPDDEQETIRREMLATVDEYRAEDRRERDQMLVAFRQALQEEEQRRSEGTDAMTNVLLSQWNRAREDDLRFMLDRLGNLEQRTGRHQELLQYAVYTGNPDEH